MDEISKKIREALTKKSGEGFIFEGTEGVDVKTLEQFFEENDREDYIWDEDLESTLYDREDLHEEVKTPILYKVGDIIMTTRYKSRGQYIEDSPHRVLIITSKVDNEGTNTYQGFLLSSKMDKSNKYGKYPHNIYINDYSTILYKGARYNKEAFIRVDDLVEFTDNDLSVSGTWKGTATYEFMRFVQRCYDNYRKGIDNSQSYWEK